ncbi:hypothetical protein LJC48_06005 [Desulfovibrio sp. OttesenSCG-928-C06]|nr:hypothetical protein [Desulfovibrio sp. OttesenSCG-928-C06]
MSQSDAMKVEKLKLMAKSLPIGVILTLLFGGLGVIYASILGGIICTVIEIILFILAFVTLGFGAILIPFAHIVFVVFTIIKINSHNKKLLEQII